MNPIHAFESVEVAYPFRLRGAGNSQNDIGLIWQPPSYRATSRGANPNSSSTLRIPGLGVGSFSMQNRSGSTAVLGLGVRIPNHMWVAGQWTNAAGTPYAADTTDAQSDGGADFALETTTANDGFVVASQVPFNAISVDVSTASVGSPVRAVRYTDPEGDAWIDFANLLIQDGASTNLSVSGTTDANEYVIVWQVPTNWGRVQAAGLSGIPRDLYAINVRATTAPTTAAVADSLSIYRLYFTTEGITDNSILTQDFGAKDFEMARNPSTGELYGDALVALFGTANNQNLVNVQVRGR